MKKQKNSILPVEPIKGDGVKLTYIEENTFAKLIYDKPIAQRNHSIFKKLITWLKERDYYSTEIKPMIKKLRNTAPSFIMMCEFADFIKILEKVFFYYNDIRKASQEGPLVTRILADNQYDSYDRKTLIIEMQKELVSIKLDMTRNFNEASKGFDDIIDVSMQYEFGRKLSLKFRITNSKIDFDSVHDYNLMYNINIILQDAMADLFEEAYKLV